MGAPRKVVEGLRAIGVMAGGPLVLLIAALAAVRSTVRAIIRARPPSLPAALGVTAVLLYAGPVRRWMRSWGARPGEATATEPVWAIEVDAPPEAVWPWLAQIGQDRGGFLQLRVARESCRLPDAERRAHPPRVAAPRDRGQGDAAPAQRVAGEPL